MLVLWKQQSSYGYGLMASPIELQAPDSYQEGVAQECHNLEWPAKRAFEDVGRGRLSALKVL